MSWPLFEEWTIGGKIEAGDKLGGYFRVGLGLSFYGMNDAFGLPAIFIKGYYVIGIVTEAKERIKGDNRKERGRGKKWGKIGICEWAVCNEQDRRP